MNSISKSMERASTYMLSKNRAIDALIYRVSRGKSISDTIRFKIWLSVKKLRHISDFNPIIIGGCPRSGTTLARALIGVHPKISSPHEECNILLSLDNKDVLKNVLGLSIDEIDDLDNKYSDTIHHAEHVLKLYLQKDGKQLVALKHPFHIQIIDKLFYHFPNMKFVHVIRDGRDASCSLRTFPKRKMLNGEIVPNVVRNPFAWCIRRWASCVNQGKKWRKSDRYIEVKYEDLVNNPVNAMEKLYNFLEVEMIAKDKLLHFYKHEEAEKHLQNIEVGMPIYKKTIGRWKRDMSEAEKKMFKRMAGEISIELGYEKNLD